MTDALFRRQGDPCGKRRLCQPPFQFHLLPKYPSSLVSYCNLWRIFYQVRGVRQVSIEIAGVSLGTDKLVFPVVVMANRFQYEEELPCRTMSICFRGASARGRPRR